MTRTTGCNLEKTPCGSCNGKGTVPGPYSEWLEIGRKFSQWRRSQDMSLREAATKLGVGIVHLSGMEHGRNDPAALEAAMQAGEKWT